MPDFGKRNDGTQKGAGFLGLLERPDGRVSSELSVGVELDGKEVLIPTLVPTLNKKEINFLLNMETGDAKSIPETIMKKATDHALKRMDEGRSPFIEDDEKQAGPQSQTQEPTGSLLQDITLPNPGDLEQGSVELFLGGDLPTPPAVDPQEAEVNKFLSGG